MISKECKITVSGNTASIDSEIYLYKNDMNIKYLFNIVNGDYAYTKDSNLDNIINANKASYAQIKFKKEDIEIDFDVQETSNGKVILLIKKELIDEDTELGDYTIQIRLFDESKTSVITLPPVNNCIHIMRPIFEKVDGSTNVVDEAAVDEAIVTYSEPMEAIASDGTFAKKTWVAKEKITTAELNRMEEGIAYNNSQYKDIAKKVDNIEQGGTGGSTTADGITIKDTGNNFTATNVEGALSELFQSASNGKTLVANAVTGKGVATNPSDSFQTMATNIGKIKNSSSAIINQNTLNKCGAKKIKFAVLSDIHIYTDTTKSANVCFTNALNNIKNMGDVDFIAITGDIVRYDFANEITTYKNTISSCTIPIYEVAGNHDATTGDSGLNLTAWKNATGQDPHYEIINNNEVFLFLSQRYWDGANLLSDEDKTWLNQKLEEYKTKPRVFLFFHQYLGNCEGFGLRNGTVNNSVLTDDLETYFTNIASEYKNVIWFSGHSHTRFRYATDYPNVLAYNKNGEFCTMIHTPSLVDTNEYHVVTVYDNLVEIQGYIGNLKADAYNVYFTVDNYDYIEKVESVMLDKSSLNFTNTDTQTITATVTPSNQQNNVIWETSSSSIATVVNGVVTPVGNGNCVITAKCGDKSATCNITVNIAQSELSYTITKNLTNCSISNNANSILQNQTYIATLTANEGCEISSVSVSMGGVDITSTAYNSSNKTIGIDVVTGDIIINCTATEVAASTYELGTFTPNAVSSSYSIPVQGKYNNVFIMADTSVTGKGAKILKGEFKLNNMNGLMATNSSGSLLATIDINNVNNITFNKNSIGYSSFASENLGALKYHYITWSSLKDGINGTITPSANTNTLSIDATKLYDNVIICTSSLVSGVKSFGFVAIMKTSEGTVKSMTGYSNTQGTAWSGCKEDVASISYNGGKLVVTPGYTSAYFAGNTEYKYIAWNNE